jgi:hypothetical protein
VSQAEIVLTILAPVRFALSSRKEKLKKKKESFFANHKELLCIFLFPWRLRLEAPTFGALRFSFLS